MADLLTLELKQLLEDLHEVCQCASLDGTEQIKVAGLRATLSAIRTRIEPYGFPVSSDYIDTFLARTTDADDGRSLDVIQRVQIFGAEFNDRLISEAKAKLFVYVAPEKRRYLLESDLFGSKVATRFRPMAEDIEEAGKCLALGRGTATVFHLMRVMEIGIQELGQLLKIPAPVQETVWQVIQDQVARAIKALPRTTVAEKKRQSELSGAAAHLQHVKDAWRNEVMHPKKTYTEAQAAEVFDAVKAFSAALADII
jgi:hypothetical protein